MTRFRSRLEGLKRSSKSAISSRSTPTPSSQAALPRGWPARSRLAAIYSGQSGLDIYTHASSDPYQDLFGEGIFTGKGIYEVETLHAVLNRRFPRNAILSHDLIEGAYARAGLVTDIELVDDYPSHYSAYSRRQH